MTVAKRVLVSLSAAISAIGAIVNAQTAIQYEPSDIALDPSPVRQTGNRAGTAERPLTRKVYANNPIPSPITIHMMYPEGVPAIRAPMPSTTV